MGRAQRAPPQELLKAGREFTFGDDDDGDKAMTNLRLFWKRVATLSTIWFALALAVLLVDYVGVRFFRSDYFYGAGMCVGFVLAIVSFGFVLHVPGSRDLLSYRALAAAFLLAFAWFWFVLSLELSWFHVAIGGELHL